jgi:hypothetical protein
MEGVGNIDLQKKLLLEHQKEITNQIHDLNENLEHIHLKIKMYEFPNAV